MGLIAGQTNTFNVLGTNTITNCTTFVKYVLKADECPGLYVNDKVSDFEVSPNPFSTAFKITCSGGQKPSAYSIYDAFGIRVSEGILEEENTFLQTEHLPAGIYFVTIGKKRKKIVKAE